MPRNPRKNSKARLFLKRVPLVFGSAVSVILVLCLAEIYPLGSISVRRQNGWDFAVRHWTDIFAAETFHFDTYELQYGPMSVYYTFLVTAGPIMRTQTITVGEQWEVEISAQHINRSEGRETVLLYRFRDLQRGNVTAMYSLGTSDSTNGLRFDPIASENSQMVGIVEHSNPNVVVILHDFSSGFSWPRTFFGAPAFREQAESIVSQLAQDNQLPNLVLGSSPTHFRGGVKPVKP